MIVLDIPQKDGSDRTHQRRQKLVQRSRMQKSILHEFGNYLLSFSLINTGREDKHWKYHSKLPIQLPARICYLVLTITFPVR